MICSKRILTIFFIFVLALPYSNLLGQVVIKEEVKIKPGEAVNGEDQNMQGLNSASGFPCDADITGGDCHHYYQVVWSNSTFPLDPLQQPFNYQGNNCILDPYVGSNYDVEIISGAQYCTIYECSRNYDEEMVDVGNSLIDVSLADFIPEGNTIQLFDGMPMNIGYCKYIIQFEDTRSRTSNVTYTFRPHGSADLIYFHTTIIKPIDFKMELLQSHDYIFHNGKMDLYLDPRRQEGNCYPFMFSNGGSFPDYLKMSAQIITGSEYGTLYYEPANTFGDYLSGLNNDEPVWFYADGIQPVDTQLVVVRLKADEYPAVDAEFYILPGDAGQLFISFDSPELEPWYGTGINIKGYLDGEFKNFSSDQLFTLKITEGMEYANLVSTLDWSESNEYDNISLENVFLAANDIPGDTAKIILYAETFVDDDSSGSGGGGDTSIKEKKATKNLKKTDDNGNVNGQIKLFGYGEILIVKTGARLNVSFDKNPIAPGESANILIEGINDEGAPFDFPPDQTFYLSLGDGTKYGELFSTSTGQIGDFIENATKEFIFNAKDSIDVDSAYVDVFVMAEYESGDGLGKANAAVNNRKMNHASRIAEKFKAVNGSKEKSLLNKSISKTSSTSEYNSVDETFYLYGMGRLLITEDSECDEPIIECDSNEPQSAGNETIEVLGENQTWQWIDADGNVKTTNTGSACEYLRPTTCDSIEFGKTYIMPKIGDYSNGADIYNLLDDMEVTVCLDKSNPENEYWQFNVSNVRIPVFSDHCPYMPQNCYPTRIDLGDGTNTTLLANFILNRRIFELVMKTIDWWKDGPYLNEAKKKAPPSKFYFSPGIISHENFHVQQTRLCIPDFLNSPYGYPIIRDLKLLKTKGSPCPENALNQMRMPIQNSLASKLTEANDLKTHLGVDSVTGQPKSELAADKAAQSVYKAIKKNIENWAKQQSWY